MKTKHVARRHSIGSLRRRRMGKLKRKNSERKLSRGIEKLRADMVEISEGQKKLLAKRDGEFAKDPKKMKENPGNEIAQLSNVLENQENRMDDLLHQLKELGYAELEEFNEKFAILCPVTEVPVDITSLQKYRTQMLDRRIQLLYEMVFK